MQPSTPEPTPSDSPGCLSYLIFAAVAAWIVVISVVAQAGGWFADQVLLIEGLPTLGGWWLAVSLGHALLLALPVLPLTYLTRAPHLRAAYQAWAVAIAAIALFGLSRMFFITHVQ